MASWQKRARLVIAALGVAVIVIVALTVRHRQAPPTTTPVKRVDPRAVSESSGVVLTQSTGQNVPGVVHAERTLTYADGSTRLINAKVTKDRDGLRYVVSGNEAQVGTDQSNVAMHGDVHLLSSDGLDATTDQATYSRGEGVIRAPGPVKFRKGTLSGTSIGMSFDEGRDVLWLLDQAVVKVAPGEKTGGGADIVSGTAGYARRDNYMRFERGVKVTREDREIAAETATAFLAPGGGRLENLELRGNSSIVARGAVLPGGLQAMRSHDMNLAYGPDGETLERAVLSGEAAIQLAGDGGKPGRRIAGENVDVSFGSTGEVTSLVARDNVELKIPGDKDTPERVIHSTTMKGTGEQGKGLTGATFQGDVDFREARGPGQLRRARAQTLVVAMAPGSGDIQEARFSGNTRFEDGTLRASAADGRYQIAEGMLALSGSEGKIDPRVQDERVTVDAKRIDLTFEGTKMKAEGDVRSLLKPADKSKDPKAKATRVPGMLKDDKPVNVTAAHLDYDGGNSLATYTGAARLWQDDTTILGETIILDETSGDLKSHGGEGMVRSTFTLEQVNATTQETEAVPSIATGKDLHYEDALRRATYTTDAHVNGPQGDCRAVKIEMYFAETGNTLERAEAYQQVTVLSDTRTATGDRMTYFAADEKYVMTGRPVKTIDEECRETTGKTLTFWRTIDRIIVDGNEEVRTLTTNTAAPAGGAPATCTPRPKSK